MAKTSQAKKADSSKRVKRPNINQIRARIRALSKDKAHDEGVLMDFAEFINGGAFKEIEPSMVELKHSVVQAFGCASYAELKKNGNFKLFVQDHQLKMNNKAAWLTVYRKFVGLPESESNSIGNTSINGVDILRNFLPWKVFNLNPKDANAADIKAAFNRLAKEHHPDHGGNPEVFEKLKNMRDSLLAAY